MSYVTGISGNVISAASAGFAPTNSADVSAIASAYATGGVDSATVSAIASAYQVVSSLDTSYYNYNGTWVTGVKRVNSRIIAAAVHFDGRELATQNDISGVIDTVSANSASWAQAGVDSATVSAIASSYAESAVSSKLDESATADFYSTSNPSSFVDSAYVDSAVSAKLDSSASSSFYPVDNPSGFITGVDLSDYATTGYVDSSVSGKLDSSASSSFYTVDNPSGFITGVDLSPYQLTADMSGYIPTGESANYQPASAMTAYQLSGDYALSADVSGVIDTVSSNSASWGGGATGDYVEKSANEVAIGYSSIASATSFAQGNKNRASIYSFTQGNKNSATSDSFAQGDTNSAGNGSFAQGYHNSAILYSFAQGFYNSAINTAAVFGQYNLHGDGNTSTGNSAAFAIGDGTASTARHDLMLVTKDGEITMYSSTADTVGTGIMSSIRAISAAATGGGGVDSATVSSIASSYAQDVSAAASGTVDLVSTQSANWGGSALGLSAGPGVKLEKVGDTLVASVDGPAFDQETPAGYWNGSAIYHMLVSGTAVANGTTNMTLPTAITGSNVVNKWVDPSNSFIYYNNSSNILPISWQLAADRHGSIGFVGANNLTYRGNDTGSVPISAYVSIKYFKV